MKDYWGRPRPIQIREFVGQWEYRQVLSAGTPGKGKSFPCGHATMGFIFLSLCFLRRRSRAVAASGLIAGIGLGGVVSAGRVVQGAHFLSDAVWSLGIVIIVSAALYYLILRIPEDRPPFFAGLSARKRAAWAAACTGAGLVILTACLMHRPH